MPRPWASTPGRGAGRSQAARVQQAAGGPGYVIGQLLQAGLMHGDVLTVRADGLQAFARIPQVSAGQLVWQAAAASGDDSVLRPVSSPFSPTGGLRLLKGNIGRSVIKTSAVPVDRHVLRAPAKVFDSQEALLESFKSGALEQICQANSHNGVVCVVRWQGPQANGMPELHKLTPPLAVLQGKGYKVALVTDGRMSGASGKVPAAIHVSPEALAGGPLAKVRDGDVILLDAEAGIIHAEVDDAAWSARGNATMPAELLRANGRGLAVNCLPGSGATRTAQKKGLAHGCSTDSFIQSCRHAPVIRFDRAARRGATRYRMASPGGGGIRVLEVTLRTPQGLPSIEAIAKAVPAHIVGARHGAQRR
ncbi:hypothetical protein FQA39_LY19259 [Lamprigera yunnana]|nr:hypothetical protein FQA39_LY19259 [Lamprigera yunnana]